MKMMRMRNDFFKKIKLFLLYDFFKIISMRMIWTTKKFYVKTVFFYKLKVQK